MRMRRAVLEAGEVDVAAGTWVCCKAVPVSGLWRNLIATGSTASTQCLQDSEATGALMYCLCYQ